MPDRDHGAHHGGVLSEPVDRRREDAEGDERLVQDPEVVVVDPDEELGGHHQRGSPRHDQRPPDDSPAGETLVQELGQAERDHDGDRHDRGHPHDRVHDHREQRGLLQQPNVVLHPDEALVEAGDGIAGERGAHQRDGGIEHDGGDEQQARAEPEEGRPVAPPVSLPHPHGPRQRLSGCPPPGRSSGAGRELPWGRRPAAPRGRWSAGRRPSPGPTPDPWWAPGARWAAHRGTA